ncbi:MAG: hypothetical protein ABFC98_03395 [Candidatus Cloacimonas sp.]
MKAKILFTFILLIASLCAAIDFSFVDMENYGSGVTRIVTGFKGSGNYDVVSGSNYVEVTIDNENASRVNISYEGGNIVRSIEQKNNRLRIAISPAYRLEKMVLEEPLRLVLDIIVAKPNRQQKLDIADFYTSCGKLNSADKIYGELNNDYPSDGEILYKWALLLEQRGSNRAKGIVTKIPKNSAYYSAGQDLLARLNGQKIPATPPPEKPSTPEKIMQKEEPRPIEPTQPIQEPPATEEIIKMPMPETLIANPPMPEGSQKSSLPSEQEETKESFLDQNPLLIVFIVLLVLLLCIIFIFLHGSKKKFKPSATLLSEIKATNTNLDTDTLCRMVSKLLENGWTNRQIAKELKLPEEEVERLVKLCHQGNYD